MDKKIFRRYWLSSILGALLLSFYPLLMGVSVIRDMIVDGTVTKENYPKYIIPYTPIAFAVIIGVLLMPLIVKLFKRLSTVVASVLSVGAFFGFELLFENKVVVTSTETVTKRSQDSPTGKCLCADIFHRKSMPGSILLRAHRSGRKHR